LCGLAPQRGRIDEVDECALAADLHDRQPFPIPGLEVRVTVDLDLLEAFRAEFCDQRLARALAEVAPAPAVEDDVRDKSRGSSSPRPPA
jgi:hypothetical protein